MGRYGIFIALIRANFRRISLGEEKEKVSSFAKQIKKNF